MTNRGNLSSSEYVVNSIILWTTNVLSTILLLAVIFFGGSYLFLHLLDMMLQKIDPITPLIDLFLINPLIAIIALLVIGGLFLLYSFCKESLLRML